MALVRIENLEPGMTLIKDAVHATGRTLITAGYTIKEKDLNTLKTWGVTEVHVHAEEDDDDPLLPEANAEHVSKFMERLQHAFRFNDLSHPFIAELFEVCKTSNDERKL